MSDPTPPAVSDAMREAVARKLAELDGWTNPAALWTDNAGMIARGFMGDPIWWDYREEADALCAPAGPIASEIARLTGERDAARREVEGYDRSHALQRQRWREDEQFKRLDRIRQQIAGLRPGDAEVIADAQSRIHAAEAEAARLRAALEPFVREADRISPAGCECEETIGDSVRVWQSGPAEITRSRITYGDLRRARTALSSQEKTDV